MDKPRLYVASHSLVAERQHLFFDHFENQSSFDVVQICPRNWGPHGRAGGLDVTCEDMATFTYRDLDDVVKNRGSPDIIYCQNEAWCVASQQMRRLAMEHGAKFVLFAWDNIAPIKDEESRMVAGGADLIICGNSEAQEKVRQAIPSVPTVVMPQVGIDSDLFRVMKDERGAEGVFIGRHAEEKGYEMVRTLWREFGVWNPGRGEYRWVPLYLNQGKVHLCPSIDTPFWKEQFAPYSAIEALMCGCYQVSSDSRAPKEWLEQIPGVRFHAQRSYEGMRADFSILRDEYGRKGPNYDGRKEAVKRFSLEAVSKRLDDVLAEVTK